MLRDKIIRAWRDPEFRFGLSNEEQAELPESPAGAIELTDEELEQASGGNLSSNRFPASRSALSSSRQRRPMPSRSSSSSSAGPSSNSNSNSQWSSSQRQSAKPRYSIFSSSRRSRRR